MRTGGSISSGSVSSACVGEGRIEAERAAHLAGDGEGLLAVAVRAEAHAINAVARACLYGLVVPGKFPRDPRPEAFGAVTARERPPLHPDGGRLLDDDRRVAGELNRRREELRPDG